MTEVGVPPEYSRDSWAALPTPARIEAYERACPGVAARMLDLIEKQHRHAQEMERWALRIRLFGYLCALTSVIVLALLAKHFADAGAAVEGATIVITGAVSLAGVFVTGRMAAHRVRKTPAKP
jgi:uncharacterized membrane protein